MQELTEQERVCMLQRKQDLLEILEYIDKSKAKALRKAVASIGEIKSVLKISIVSLRVRYEQERDVSLATKKTIAEMKQIDLNRKSSQNVI